MHCKLRNLLFLLLAATTLLLNFRDLRNYLLWSFGGGRDWHGRSYCTSTVITDELREMIERNVPPECSLSIVKPSGQTSSFYTALQQTLAWSRIPHPVALGSSEDSDFLLAQEEIEVPSSFSPVDTNPYWTLYAKNPSPQKCTPPPSASPVRECCGIVALMLLVLLALLNFGWPAVPVSFALFGVFALLPRTLFLLLFCAALIFLVKKSRIKDIRIDVPAVFLFAFFTSLALGHTLLAPNGVGVVGGKAKLLFCSGFGELLGNTAWRSLEPAYPPGAALTVLGCFRIAGECGEWLIQLAGCFATALLASFLFSGVSWRCRLWIATFFCAVIPLQVATSLYPEPFAALCLLAGWRLLETKDGKFFGWLLIGLCAWFKNEGLFFLFAAWIAFRLLRGKESADFRHLLIALALPVLWHMLSRLCGARLNGYALLPDASRFLQALTALLQSAFLKPWHTAFIFPFSLLLAKRNPVAVLFAFLSILFLAAAYSFSAAPDFSWHLTSSIPRVLFLPSFVLFLTLKSLPKNT